MPLLVIYQSAFHVAKAHFNLLRGPQHLQRALCVNLVHFLNYLDLVHANLVLPVPTQKAFEGLQHVETALRVLTRQFPEQLTFQSVSIVTLGRFPIQDLRRASHAL